MRRNARASASSPRADGALGPADGVQEAGSGAFTGRRRAGHLPAPAARAGSGYTPPGMARILVADDHDALREGMALSLTRLGHEVLAVKGGAEAIAAYKKRAADVVVTDLRMIPVDGIEVVKRLRSDDPDATVLVELPAADSTAFVAALMSGNAPTLGAWVKT